MKLLIAGPDTFAKVVCSTLLVRCLKQQLPEVQIHYQIKEQLKDALEANPYIDVLETETSTWHETESIDCVIDLTASKEWKGVAAKKDYAYLSPKNSLLQRLGIDLGQPKLHLATQYLSAAKSLMVRDDGLGMNYFIPPAAHVAAQDIPTAHSAGYIVLVLDAHFLADDFIRLLYLFCKALPHPVILVGEKNVVAAAAHLSAIDRVKIYVACGKFTHHETADLIHKSKMVITPETGWMQVAVAFKKQVIALRHTNKPSAYFPPVYAQEAANQDKSIRHAMLHISGGQKQAQALAEQLLQTVQQFLLKQ